MGAVVWGRSKQPPVVDQILFPSTPTLVSLASPSVLTRTALVATVPFRYVGGANLC